MVVKREKKIAIVGLGILIGLGIIILIGIGMSFEKTNPITPYETLIGGVLIIFPTIYLWKSVLKKPGIQRKR